MIPLTSPSPTRFARAHLASALASRAPSSSAPPLPASLYIHVPFCFHKCHYCDFYSIVDTRDRQAPFVDRLARELDALAPFLAQPVRTIFVGGGTPSLLRPQLWEALLSRLRSCLDLAAIDRANGLTGHQLAIAEAGAPDDPPGEFTVECNPETVTDELMHVLASGGVTRVSVGAQSFEHTHLKALERWHNPDNVQRALDIARAHGIARQSIDLIFAIPGQTPDDWQRDLGRAVALGTEHVSCYNLTYEQGTALKSRLERGEFQSADEDTELDMHARTLRTLADAGLRRYEVSNFAQPGAQCRHNLAYWRGSDWLAAGPSAAAHVQGLRTKNTPRLDDYLQLEDLGFAPLSELEQPTLRTMLADSILGRIRLAEGIEPDHLLRRASMLDDAAPRRLQSQADHLARRGLLNLDERAWSLTDAGFLLADHVARTLIAALDAPAAVTQPGPVPGSAGAGPGPRA